MPSIEDIMKEAENEAQQLRMSPEQKEQERTNEEKRVQKLSYEALKVESNKTNKGSPKSESMNESEQAIYNAENNAQLGVKGDSVNRQEEATKVVAQSSSRMKNLTQRVSKVLSKFVGRGSGSKQQENSISPPPPPVDFNNLGGGVGR